MKLTESEDGMTKQRGFSLIELLIVVAIILVIAAIAIPSLLRSRIAANEASAAYSLRAVNTAQTTYATTYPQLGFADDLAKLGSPTGGGAASSNNAGILDFVLGCATQPCAKSGYEFRIANVAGNPVASYSAFATPQILGKTGTRGFCTDASNLITVDFNGSTNCTTPLQ